jgi:SAM-dependent methyltransferase
MLKQVLRGNYLAPLSKPASILDVGCGTGRWALDLAAEFPAARVVGVDITPPDEDEETRRGLWPPNFSFALGNILDGLRFPNSGFDFVHQRGMASALPADRWQDDVDELVRLTASGGWVELMEDDFAHGEPALNAIGGWAHALCLRRGIDFRLGGEIGTYLQRAGLAQVVFRQIDMPVGSYGGHLGAMAQADYLSAMEALRPNILSLGITSASLYEAALREARFEMMRGACVWPLYVAYGQR